MAYRRAGGCCRLFFLASPLLGLLGAAPFGCMRPACMRAAMVASLFVTRQQLLPIAGSTARTMCLLRRPPRPPSVASGRALLSFPPNGASPTRAATAARQLPPLPRPPPRWPLRPAAHPVQQRLLLRVLSRRRAAPSRATSQPRERRFTTCRVRAACMACCLFGMHRHRPLGGPKQGQGLVFSNCCGHPACCHMGLSCLHPTLSYLQAAASTTAPRLSLRRESASSARWRRRRRRAGAPLAPRQ